MSATPDYQNFLHLLKPWIDLSNTDFTDQWEDQAGIQIRNWFATHGPYFPEPDQRSLLETAIRRISLQPDNWSLHLQLLLQGRIYTELELHLMHAPPSFARWLNTQLNKHGFLKILPPLPQTQLTLLLPTYNRLSRLKIAVQSILAQTHHDWQLIIADDGSTDGTPIWCKMLADMDPRITYLRSETNRGLYATMEWLYQACPSELVMSLADDDCLMPTCVASTLNVFAHYPWIAMAGGGYFYLHFQQGQLRLKQFGPYYATPCIADPRTELQRVGLINPIFGGGALWRKSELLRLSATDPEIGDFQYSSWDWFLSAECLSHYEVGYTPEIVVAYIDHHQDRQFTQSRNWGLPFLKLLTRLLTHYEKYFGMNSYPAEIIQYFLIAIAEPYLVQAYQHHLCTHGRAEEMEVFINSQRPAWHLHRMLRQQLQKPRPPALFNAETVAGLSAGNIPELQHGQIPPALKWLLEQLNF